MNDIPYPEFRCNPVLEVPSTGTLLDLATAILQKDSERAKWELQRKAFDSYRRILEILQDTPEDDAKFTAEFTTFQGLPNEYKEVITKHLKIVKPNIFKIFEVVPPQSLCLQEKTNQRTYLIETAGELFLELLREFQKKQTQQLYPEKAEIEIVLSKRFIKLNTRATEYIKFLVVPVCKKFEEIFVKIEATAKLSSETDSEPEN